MINKKILCHFYSFTKTLPCLKKTTKKKQKGMLFALKQMHIFYIIFIYSFTYQNPRFRFEQSSEKRKSLHNVLIANIFSVLVMLRRNHNFTQ